MQISQNYNLDNDDNYSGSPNNFQDYRNNFVDSPPDSKEAWPVEYSKMQSGLVPASTNNSNNAGPNNSNGTSNANSAVAAVAAAAAAVAAAQQQDGGVPYSGVVMPTRKRRIEWMSAHHQDQEENDSSEPKIASTDKERETRRKGKQQQWHPPRGILDTCYLSCRLSIWKRFSTLDYDRTKAGFVLFNKFYKSCS